MKFLVILIILILILFIGFSKDVFVVINRIRLYFNFALNILKQVIWYTLLIFWYILFYGFLSAVFIQICETKSILTRIGWTILFLIDLIKEFILWLIGGF